MGQVRNALLDEFSLCDVLDDDDEKGFLALAGANQHPSRGNKPFVYAVPGDGEFVDDRRCSWCACVAVEFVEQVCHVRSVQIVDGPADDLYASDVANLL